MNDPDTKKKTNERLPRSEVLFQLRKHSEYKKLTRSIQSRCNVPHEKPNTITNTKIIQN